MDLIELKKRESQTVQQRHPWEIARLDSVQHIIKNVLFDGKLNVWDVGCGDTFVVEQLCENYPSNSYKAVDIAFDDELITLFSKRLEGKRIEFHSSIEEASKASEETIDVILLMDVIEHIEDEISFLKKLLSLPNVTEKTQLVITVPAYQSLFCTHDVYLEHYRRYTNKSLKKALEEAGLKVDRKGYFFSLLLLPRIFQKIKEKISRPKDNTTGLVEWKGSKGKSKFLSSILFLDFKVTYFLKKTGLNIPGLSNYAICLRSA